MASSSQLGTADQHGYDENQTVHLLQLPEDIISHIFSYLDVRTMVRAWEASTQLRRASTRRRLIRRVHLHNWRMSCAVYDVLRECPLYIEELDLSYAKGLSEALAVPAIEQLHNLQSLDVTSTAMTLAGASAVCAACPRLVRLACDFTSYQYVKKEGFKNLQYAHFTLKNWATVNPLRVLERCTHLKEFKFSTGKVFNRLHEILECYKLESSKHPNLRAVSCHIIVAQESSISLSLRDYFRATEWDIIFAVDFARKAKLYLSSNFDRAAERMKIEGLYNPVHFESLPPVERFSSTTLDVYAWRTDLIELNPHLHSDVLREFCSKPSREICSNNFRDIPPSVCSNSYVLRPCTFNELYAGAEKGKVDMNLFKFVPTDRKVKIFYPTLKCQCYQFVRNCDIILADNFPVLRNVVHLSLSEQNFDPDLFCVLLRECVHLETLSVNTASVNKLLEAVQRNRSIRNLRVACDMKGEFWRVFRALAACFTLENVCIDDLGTNATFRESDVVDFLTGCYNLGRLYIRCHMSQKSEGKLRNTVKGTMKRLELTDLEFVLKNSNQVLSAHTDPVDVYLLNSIFDDSVTLGDLEVNRKMVYA